MMVMVWTISKMISGIQIRRIQRVPIQRYQGFHVGRVQWGGQGACIKGVCIMSRGPTSGHGGPHGH